MSHAPRHRRLAQQLAEQLGVGSAPEGSLARAADRLAQYEQQVEAQATPDRAQVVERLRGLTVAVRTGRSPQAAVRTGQLDDGSIAEVLDVLLGVPS